MGLGSALKRQQPPDPKLLVIPPRPRKHVTARVVSSASQIINEKAKEDNEKRLTDREAWTQWYSRPLNKMRAWAASIMFGKKGWKLFHQSYYQTAIDLKVKQIESQIPKTWQATIHHMPEWIQLITEEEHKGTL